MNQYFKSEGQCQGHKISIFEIVEKLEFLVNLNQFLVKYCRRLQENKYYGNRE